MCSANEPFCRGVTGIFFWGSKVIFPDFFPSWNVFSRKEIPILVDPKLKKKMSSPLFITFHFSYFHFQFSTFTLQFSSFSSFSSQFLPLSHFSFPHVSQYVSKNFLVWSLWGHSAPPPPVTPLPFCNTKYLPERHTKRWELIPRVLLPSSLHAVLMNLSVTPICHRCSSWIWMKEKFSNPVLQLKAYSQISYRGCSQKFQNDFWSEVE